VTLCRHCRRPIRRASHNAPHGYAWEHLNGRPICAGGSTTATPATK
jgi:hypothetical protein